MLAPLGRDPPKQPNPRSTPSILPDIPEKSPRESVVVRAVWYYRSQNSLDSPRPECQHCHQCAKRGSERRMLLLLIARSLLPPCEMKAHKENSASECVVLVTAAALRAIGSVG